MYDIRNQLRAFAIVACFAYHFRFKPHFARYFRAWCFGIAVTAALVVVALASCGPRPSRLVPVPPDCAMATRPELPMKVTIDYSIPTDVEAWWYEAGEDWRKAAGLKDTLFTPDTDGLDRSDVWVHWAPRAEDVSKNAIARVITKCENGRLWYDVEWFSNVVGWEAYYFVLHEVGHVLGVAHSYNRGSVMYPTLDVDFLSETESDEGYQYGWYTILDDDAAIVSALWR